MENPLIMGFFANQASFFKPIQVIFTPKLVVIANNARFFNTKNEIFFSIFLRERQNAKKTAF